MAATNGQAGRGQDKQTVLRNMWKKRAERPKEVCLLGIETDCAPSQKGWVVNGRMTKASNKLIRLPSATPPSHRLTYLHASCRFPKLTISPK